MRIWFILCKQIGREVVYLIAYYAAAITVLALHYTGHLERWGMDWLVFVMALTVFPAVIYL